MTYKFPQFNVQIVNPTISINLNTISDKALDKLLGVSVLLSTTNIYKINVSSGGSPASFSIVDRFSQFNSYIACRTFTVTGTTLS